ncbi:hypothetical protein SAMN04489724_2707 [Algoriphagus locisalis]|uniref:Uncharacterized protein n=1 Tax=Algoriphagus locisalis TaxID=305507 RepID=A0A1I7BTN9_9BACT|nr:hypothetical protein [Algoriphagus locisalis]SFT90568.1 hypothetical protein SAMN04489724_2707 [Algoriphagus locisalis]
MSRFKLTFSVILFLHMLLGICVNLFAQNENDTSKTSITKKALEKGMDLITRSNRDSVLVEKAEEKFLPYEGRVIRNITVENLGFEFSIYGTEKPIVQKVGRIANKLHTNTREKTIRQHLFIKPNQLLNPYKLGDNERYLRDQSFILESRIVVTPIEGTDSVDLAIVTRDIFSFGGSLGGTIPTSPLLKVYNANLDGRGQGFEFDILFDHDRTPKVGIGLAYTKSSFLGSFADFTAYYTQLNSGISAGEEKEFATGFSLERPLVSPYSKFAGGAGWSQNWSQNVDSRPDSVFLAYRYNIMDFWMGYNFGSNKALQDRKREFLALRAFDGYFINQPDQENVIDESRYNDSKGILAEFTVYEQDFFKTQYVYGFGRTEDIPSGYNISTTWGYTNTMGLKRPYGDLNINFKKASKSGSFYEFNLNGASYLRKGIEDAVLQTGGTYYTQAFTLGNYKIRNSASILYTQLYKRVTSDWLTIRSNLIPGLRVEEVDATQRIALGFESSLFTPWSLIGFRIAPFTSFYWAKLKCYTCEDRYQNFTGISLGMRIRNENLIFGTIEMKGTFLPTDDEGNSKFAFSFRKNLRFRKSDIFVTAPNLIVYN